MSNHKIKAEIGRDTNKNHGSMLLEVSNQYLKMLDQDYRFNLMMQRINVLESHMYLRQRINIWKKQNLFQ